MRRIRAKIACEESLSDLKCKGTGACALSSMLMTLVTRWIHSIECFERGALTGATIMVNMPAAAQAITYAKEHPELSFGVHLVYLTDDLERPVASPDQIPSLVTEEATFHASNTVRKMALMRRFSVEHIAAETEAQIAVLHDSGVPVSHVDSHGHIHKFPVFQEALEQVLPKFGITRMRSVENVFFRTPYRKPLYWLGKLWRRRLIKRFTTTPYFYMGASSFDRDWAEPLLGRLPLDETLEVGVHPGYELEWRDQERRDVQAFAPRAAENGHQLIGWAEL